ncbi:hypothetical protein Gotri_021298 [Gossypium trilobum]|uniref:Uncharacterized protein n=1 Tax=Gossypium trilobum TaxID=34281 RepID=A0A7J9DCF8_9ROSI|nr:hypothetical protein [Gossypium trilobum]
MCLFFIDVEFSFRVNEVIRVIVEMIVSDFCLLNNDEIVSLAYDKNEITKVHKVTNPNGTMDSIGLEIFDDLCPIEFKFDVPIMNFVLMDALCLIE